MRTLAIRHVKIEHLGLIENYLKEKNFEIDYVDTSEGQLLKRELDEYQFIVVLGGYMGAYEESKYPFLSYEFKIMEQALKKEIPLLGICLGCQMLAKVLGSKVYKGENGKEIGFYDIKKVSNNKIFEGFPEVFKAFQWHGDTFDLPKDAQLVFSNDIYTNQGFICKNAVGLQFHIEVSQNMIKQWMQEYKDEILEEKLNPDEIIKDTEIYIPNLKTYLYDFLDRFLSERR
jgi:GMP synthase-like glutamine amidotransferase